jgi:hypothetical protein
MKIGLLTFHNNPINCGTALQAYALQQTIKSMGVDCKIIDYINDYRKKRFNMLDRAKKELKKKNIDSAVKYFIGSLFMRCRKRKFLKFYNRYLDYTNKSFKSSEEMKILNKEFDKFIVGSDQVWNYNINGNDFTYFLDFVKESNKKIAYAPSFGLTNIPDNLKDKYKNNLKLIKYLSARENYGIQLIKKITGREANLVLDPVFLLSKEQWLSLCKNNQRQKKYIFCYTAEPGQWKNFLIQTKFSLAKYKINKLTKPTIKDLISPRVKVDICISPMDFIERIVNARLVVSSSFHGVAMSIILNVPFIAVLSGDRGKDERLLNILKIAGLEHRILNKKMNLDDVNRSIDFCQAEAKIKEYRNKSISFLKNAIFD